MRVKVALMITPNLAHGSDIFDSRSDAHRRAVQGLVGATAVAPAGRGGKLIIAALAECPHRDYRSVN